MTTKQKIKILHRMYNVIKYGPANSFCYAYELATNYKGPGSINEETELPITYNDLSIDQDSVIKLGLKKPYSTYGSFWYDYADTATRLRLITRLINKLTKHKSHESKTKNNR